MHTRKTPHPHTHTPSHTHAVAAAIGAASGAMAAIYTTRKKDEESGVAADARALAESLNAAAVTCIKIADEVS